MNSITVSWLCADSSSWGTVALCRNTWPRPGPVPATGLATLANCYLPPELDEHEGVTKIWIVFLSCSRELQVEHSPSQGEALDVVPAFAFVEQRDFVGQFISENPPNGSLLCKIKWCSMSVNSTEMRKVHAWLSLHAPLFKKFCKSTICDVTKGTDTLKTLYIFRCN